MVARTFRLPVVVAAFVISAAFLPAASTGRIVVSPNHRFLQHEDGTPLFWLGDTAWLLFAKLDRQETIRYLDDRAAKGFNVVQADALHYAGMESAYGVPALNGENPGAPHVTPGSDFSKPGEYDFWDHVDWVVDQAAQRGIYIGMLPCWGSVVKNGQLNSSNVGAYARFLARRYRDKPNIFWITGGDIQGDVFPEVWNELGRTLKAEDPNHLITFHPFGRTESSTWFHNEDWLDFNMFQSGHRRYDQDTESGHMYGPDNWRYVADDYAKRPIKPTLDGEPSYENIPQGLHDPSQPYWTDADTRRYAYWSVFAGACGHTYGDNAVMQFYKPGSGGSPAYGARNYWYEAISDPGSSQMQYLKRLMLAHSYFDRVPDQSILAGNNGERYDYIAATRGGNYILVYTWTGRDFQVRMGILPEATLKASWYSPRDGSSQEIGAVKNTGVHTFQPPGSPRDGNDWVLVLE